MPDLDDTQDVPPYEYDETDFAEVVHEQPDHEADAFDLDVMRVLADIAIELPDLGEDAEPAEPEQEG